MTVMTDSPLEEPVFTPERFETAFARREHQFRQVSSTREENVERERRILASPGGLDFLARVQRVGRAG